MSHLKIKDIVVEGAEEYLSISMMVDMVPIERKLMDIMTQVKGKLFIYNRLCY